MLSCGVYLRRTFTEVVGWNLESSYRSTPNKNNNLSNAASHSWNDSAFYFYRSQDAISQSFGRGFEKEASNVCSYGQQSIWGGGGGG